jgi:hypothetical protein
MGRAQSERRARQSSQSRLRDAIDRKFEEPWKKLESYVALYYAVLRNDRMCLSGMRGDLELLQA